MSNDTQTLSLTDFLLARFAEDEAAIRSDIEVGEAFTLRPRQMVADIEAKRQIVERFDVGDDVGGREDGAFVLRRFALPYADHADYRPEWRP